LEDQIQQLIKENEELKQTVLIQHQQIEYLKRQLFGSKSEKSDPAQDELNLGGLASHLEKPEAPSEPEAEEEKQKEKTKSGPRPQRKNKLPANLPERVEEIIPEEVKANPELWRRMAQDETEYLEKEPGYFYIKKVVRPKFVRIENPFSPPIQQPAPFTLLRGAFLGEGLLSEILVNRYLYALPFYRQHQMYRQRYGIDIARSTMSDAADHVAKALVPIFDEMKVSMLSGSFIGCDETPIKYLDKENGGSKQGYYWVYRSINGEVLFDWSCSRNYSNVESFLGKGYKGIIQSDGYGAYTSYCEANGAKARAACMAHIRRKFEQSKDQRPELVRWFLRIICILYDIEAELKKLKASPELRSRIRKSRSLPYIRLLEKAVLHLKQKGTIHSKSNLGKALNYAYKQLPDMYPYLEHGEVEIDNNLVENAIRPTAVGKKNHLFIGAAEAGQKSAVIYSLLLSAKALGVPPQEYLYDVMQSLPKLKPDDSLGIAELTPAAWASKWYAKQAAKAKAKLDEAA
jgi:transposase